MAIQTSQRIALRSTALVRKLQFALEQSSLDLGIVCALAVSFLYFGYYLLAGWLKAENFAFGARDTAIYQTALWQAGQFGNPITYVMPGVSSLPLVGGHFMPIGFVYGFAYRFFPSVQTTVLIYAASFAVSGWFIFLFARTIAKNDLIAVSAQIVYLAVYTPASGHFYFEDWAVPFISAGLYFTARAKFVWATLMWIGAMMFKEYIGLSIAAFGFANWVAVQIELRRAETERPAERHRVRFVLVWVALGIAWFVIAFWGIMHYFQPVWINLGMFRAFANSDASMLLLLLPETPQILLRVLSPAGQSYLVGLFLPLAFLSLLGIEYTFALVPILLLNFLADNDHAIRDGLNGHYTTMVQPFLVAGAVVGLVRLQHWLVRRRWLWRMAVACSLICILYFVAQGLRYDIYKLRESLAIAHTWQEHTRDVNFTLSQIAPSASIAADENLLPFLAHRPMVVHLANATQYAPHYILRDSFYNTASVQVLNAGLALGANLYAHAPNEYYDRAKWEQAPVPNCSCPGYRLLMRRGSLALFVKAE